MQNPFSVNISSIAGRPGRSLDAAATGSLVGLEVSGSRVEPATPVVFKGEVQTIDGGLVGQGRVTTHWVGECRRCLGPADGAIDVEFREVFEKEHTEGETYPIEGDWVDFVPVVREAVMLELPIAPLCKPDCAGLCPVCGASKNEIDCGHTVEARDDRWAALDALKDN